MVLIDTSIWINVLKDRNGAYTSGLYQEVDGRDIVLTRFQQLELLQGCRNENEWQKLGEYLDGQDYVEMRPTTWRAAARIYFNLRKKGITIRNIVDCCIAQIAIEHRILLIHDDRDFTVIGDYFPLQHQQWPGQL